MARVGIIGASGFTGAELLRLCASHPDFQVDVAAAGTQAGQHLSAVHPSLATAYPDIILAPTDEDTLASCGSLDVVFLALPHGTSQDLIPGILAASETTGASPVIIDLAADFRLTDPADYTAWYGADHAAPELLGTFTYGLPELAGDSLTGATRIAAPGCYPTATALALAPLVESGLVATDTLVVDAASGVSGAGRAATEATSFSVVDASYTAYGLTTHRHTPEMEQVLSNLAGVPRSDVRLIFTPHLAPMTRGILATCYARPLGPLPPAGELSALYATRYGPHPFITVTDHPPATKATLGANTACVHVTADPRTGWILALCAIDNLVKGAAGQAVQCANLALGLPETAGLPLAGVSP